MKDITLYSNEHMDFIDKIDNNFLFEIGKKISQLDINRSEFKIDNFILSDIQHPTDYSKFLQIKLEMYNILLNIKITYYSYKEKLYTNELIELKIKKLTNNNDDENAIKAKIKSIQLEKNIVQMDILKNDIVNKIKELKHFYKRYNELIKYENLTDNDKLVEEKNIFKEKILFNNQNRELFVNQYGNRIVNNILKD